MHCPSDQCFGIEIEHVCASYSFSTEYGKFSVGSLKTRTTNKIIGHIKLKNLIGKHLKKLATNSNQNNLLAHNCDNSFTSVLCTQ